MKLNMNVEVDMPEIDQRLIAEQVSLAVSTVWNGHTSGTSFYPGITVSWTTDESAAA